MPTATRNRIPIFAALQQNARHKRWWIGGAGALVAALLLGWLLWPSQPDPEPPRARQYLDFTACLLTGELGVADPSVEPAWSGLQDASLLTRTKAQYLAIAGPQTVDNGLTHLNTLALTGCDLIFAAGDLPVATVDKGASQFPDKHFYPVGGGTAAGNVTPITGDADHIRDTVHRTLTAAV